MRSCNLPTTPSCSAPWVPCSIVAACSAGCRREPPRRFRAPSCGKWCVTWPWRLGDPWNPPGDSGRVPHGDIISPWSRRSSKMIDKNIRHFFAFDWQVPPHKHPAFHGALLSRLALAGRLHLGEWGSLMRYALFLRWRPGWKVGDLVPQLSRPGPGWLFGPKLWPSFLKRIGHFVWVEHFNKMTRFPRPGGSFFFLQSYDGLWSYPLGRFHVLNQWPWRNFGRLWRTLFYACPTHLKFSNMATTVYLPYVNKCI